MMTAVKMLYVCGGLQVLPTLINLLEPLRVDRDLHLTLIRNEHAYYSSIAQMMRYLPFPIPRELASCPLDDTIYVCGDSHSMSAAWQVVKLDAHPRPMILQPKLVTGLKVWHMRPACRFYPKRNFEAAIRSIPDNAQVIFNFGQNTGTHAHSRTTHTLTHSHTHTLTHSHTHSCTLWRSVSFRSAAVRKAPPPLCCFFPLTFVALLSRCFFLLCVF